MTDDEKAVYEGDTTAVALRDGAEVSPAKGSPSPYEGAGTLELSPETAAILAERAPENDIEILPTGEIYVPQVHYRRVLNKAFGPGGWALLPRGNWMLDGATVAREYALYARGRFVSEAIGEQEWHEGNDRMTKATACEAAKSNALMRCSKDLGIFSECWDKVFAAEWKKKHAVASREVDRRTQREVTRWKKNTVYTGKPGTTPQPVPEPVEGEPRPVAKPAQRALPPKQERVPEPSPEDEHRAALEEESRTAAREQAQREQKVAPSSRERVYTNSTRPMTARPASASRSKAEGPPPGHDPNKHITQGKAGKFWIDCRNEARELGIPAAEVEKLVHDYLATLGLESVYMLEWRDNAALNWLRVRDAMFSDWRERYPRQA